MQMPAINGFDLLKLLRASNIPQAQSVPVIAVTARSDICLLYTSVVAAWHGRYERAYR